MNLHSTAAQNQTLLDNFYSAFASHDWKTMSSCYHNDAVFSDPAFGELHGPEIGRMWQMLIERSRGQLKIDFSGITADENRGSADWIARYLFSKTGRNVTNRIHAKFIFSEGLIHRHYDDFNFHDWAKQAFGWKGRLVGGMSFFKDKVRNQARQALENYTPR